jgi:glycosyltransferase involved in cell wall biosynthesis
MRIVQVLADGRPGGGTSLVLDLCESLLPLQGVQVHLVSERHSHALERARALGIVPVGVDFFGSVRERVGGLRRALESLRPDLVHVHGARAGFFMSLAGRPAGARIVYTVHGYHFRGRPAWLRPLAFLAERRAHRAADVLTFVCEHDRRLARRWHLASGRTPAAVIANGVRCDRIPPARGGEPRLVAFCGRLSRPKDPLLAVRVAAKLATRGYRLRVIGGGELEPRVRALRDRLGLGDSIQLLGALPREQALEALRDARVLLLTSRWEGMPLAPLEAMHMGIPVVAAAVCGVPEMVEHGVTGLLAARRRARDFALAIQRLEEDEALRARIIREARCRVAARFDFATTVRRYQELYRDLLAAADREPAG